MCSLQGIIEAMLLILTRALIACKNIVRFSRDFYETILVGKFHLTRLVKNVQVAARE